MELACKPGHPEYIEPGSKEYLDVLGCSEVANILGWGFDTAIDVWMRKTRRAPKKAHKAIFDRGHDMEPVIIKRFGLMHPDRVLTAEQVQYRDPDRPWLIYHSDGMFPVHTPLRNGDRSLEGAGAAEIKAPGERMAEEMKREGLSRGYVCQLQMGMHVSSAALGIPVDWSTALMLNYGEYDPPVIAFDHQARPSFQEQSLEILDKFWWHVQHDKEPEPINPLHYEAPPETQGECEYFSGDSEVGVLAKRIAKLTVAITPATKELTALKDEMKELLTGFQVAEVPGVMKFSYRWNKDSEKVNGEGLLTYCQYLVERHNEIVGRATDFDPDLEPIDFDPEQWITRKPGPRVLRTTIPKE